MPNLSTALALYEFSTYKEIDKISGRSFYFDSTSTNQTYTMRMPIGTSVNVDGVLYEGADATNVVANVTHSGTIGFIESVPGCITYFFARNNGLSGNIPDLSLNVNLTHFYCYGNQLTGNIPDLSNNTVLREFNCNTNQLTGTLPDLSANIELRDFQCMSNRLTGSIPNLSLNTSLQYFYCISNQLTGNIPDLSNNTSLRYIRLGSNKLTGFDGGTIKVKNEFSAYYNLLTVEAVDAILQALVDGGTVNVRVLLQGGNGVPTNTAAIDTLRSNGCTVTVEGGY